MTAVTQCMLIKQAVWPPGSADMVCPHLSQNPDLWLFDLETGVRVASKVGNLYSKFGH